MLWHIIKWLIIFFFVDKATKVCTGKHIHEHVFSWWCSLRDRILTWVRENAGLRIASVVGTVVEWVDDAMV
ncbi:MAG: hypothetical protein WCK05_09445 [Planctomycetota bacterium]